MNSYLELVRQIEYLRAEIERLKTHDAPGGVDPGSHVHSKLTASDGAPDPAISADATGKVGFPAGTSVNEFSTDGTLAGNSDDAVPTEKAVKTYVDKIWTTWTPTVTQGVGVSVSVAYARYAVVGDIVTHQIYLNITSAGTAGQPIQVAGIPAAIQPTNVSVAVSAIGTAVVVSNSAATWYHAALVATAANDLRMVINQNPSYLGTLPNVGLVNGDIISFQATYER